MASSSTRASASNRSSQIFGGGQDQSPAHASDEEDRGGDIAETLRQSAQFMEGPVLYTRRYAMLAMFAALGFIQCAVWNTWGPIASSAVEAYPALTPSNIATLAIWGPVTCLTGTIFCTLLIQKRGMRTAMIVSSLLMAVGTSLRCTTQDPALFMTFAHLAAILNGFAGVVVGIAPALLSSLWFPVSFRTTATSVGCTFNQLGNAGGFFLGPFMVEVLDGVASGQRQAGLDHNAQLGVDRSSEKLLAKTINDITNSSTTSFTNVSAGTLVDPVNVGARLKLLNSNGLAQSIAWNTSRALISPLMEEELSEWHATQRLHGLTFDTEASDDATVSPEEQELLRHLISNYMFIVAGVSLGLLVLIIAFFEDEPPTPPTVPVPEILSRSGRSSIAAYARSLRDSSRVPTSRTATSRTTTSRTATSRAATSRTATSRTATSRTATSHTSTSRTSTARNRPLTETLSLAIVPFRNRSFMVMLLAYSITMGINVAWSSMLEISLRPLGVSQATIEQIVYSLSDCSVSCVMSSIITLPSFRPRDHINKEWQLQASASLAGSLNYAVSPLFFELGMELGYPAPEDVVGSILSMSWNIAGVLCLFALQQQGADLHSALLLDYTLVAQGVLVVVLLFFVKEEYRRSGPQKLVEELQSTMRRGRVDYDDVSGYGVSDDSDDDESPRRGISHVRLLADSSSSEDGGHDNPACDVP
ncbi:uncharacterized protein LOC108671370 [Hyalella azteca]|uniref:Uncharacterized protein LOC108671370 n=1 Tax=Hyalella azteca TaxID=294128 RepID=A0A979FGF4_HYAAZ|nr:uncharacterized protein LOC108671370 [Hyalella azteca]